MFPAWHVQYIHLTFLYLNEGYFNAVFTTLKHGGQKLHQLLVLLSHLCAELYTHCIHANKIMYNMIAFTLAHHSRLN